MQDLLALSDKYNGRPAADETINDPTVRKHYWRYRCHVNLESLLDDKVFLLNLQHMLLGETRRIQSSELMESNALFSMRGGCNCTGPY